MGDGETTKARSGSAGVRRQAPVAELTALIDYNKTNPRADAEIQTRAARRKMARLRFTPGRSDGHDVAALRSVFRQLPFSPDKPSAIICHTVKGKGIPFAENDPNWHHKAKLSAETVSQMYGALE